MAPADTAQDATIAPVGFVGLGAIGRPMVDALLRAGVPVVVHDLDAAAMADVATRGATVALSLADLAEAVTLVGVCVPADEHVRAVLRGADGLLAHLARGSVVAIHSTVLPETVIEAEAGARAVGITLVEAAVTGGTMAAAEARSTFLLGGDPAGCAALEPILAACGGERIHAGAVGQASRLKLCLNLQTYVTFTGVFEAATLATSLGLPLDTLKAAMRANGQLGELVENYLLGHDLTAETLADPDIAALLAGYAAIIEKDLRLIRSLAAAAGVPVPAAELAGARARRVYFLDSLAPDPGPEPDVTEPVRPGGDPS